MTVKQKQQIIKFYEQGYSFRQISKMMDLSIQCIRTYCKRHGLSNPNTQQNLINKKAECELDCLYCKRIFTSYDNRKYCCHECYIKHRLGGSF